MLRAASVVLLAAHAVGADTYNVVVNGAMNEPLTVIGDAWAAGSDSFGSYIASSPGCHELVPIFQARQCQCTLLSHPDISFAT